MAANIDSNIINWSTTASSNQPDTTDTNDIVSDLRQVQAVVRKYLQTTDTIASGSTVDLSTVGGPINIVTHSTGTTAITSFGTLAAGPLRFVRFSISGGTLTLTHNATSMKIPGSANLTLSDGDCLLAETLGSGNWKIHAFFRAAGIPPVTNANLVSPTFTGTTTISSGSFLADASTNLSLGNSSGANLASISGGMSSIEGAALWVYGDTHATKPNYVELRQNNTLRFTIDNSGDSYIGGNATTAASVKINTVSGSVNYLSAYGSGTGSVTKLYTEGTDTNISWKLSSKGSGSIFLCGYSGVSAALGASTESAAVNYVSVVGTNSGNGVQINAAGTDANVDLKLSGQGTGVISFGTYSSSGDVACNGYITIKDAGGTTRKLMTTA